MNTYTIDPRPEYLGSGWKLAVFQGGQEVAGGVFEAGDEGYQEAVDRAEWIIEGLGELS